MGLRALVNFLSFYLFAMLRTALFTVIGCLLLLAPGACASDQAAPAPEVRREPGRFTLLPAEETGIRFRNDLQDGPNTNILVYEYFYNGGGVAAADFNGDGRTDLYFTANMRDNALYLNEGDWKFTEVAARSGALGRPGPWKTGVTVADVNADGKPDIYLSYSGMVPPEKRRNQLFINQGNSSTGTPLFRDEAARYGLDLPAFTNQAYFFDYDNDGDLDVVMLNHNPKSLPVLNVEKTRELLATPDPERGTRLLRNDGGTFHDVTEAAGINGSQLSYGLGLALSDINGDGFVDFYVSNDYEVPDYLYVNNGDGTFTDQLAERIRHTSHFSMGSDIADINNDEAPDIYTLDMQPADNRRRKLLMADDNRSRHDLNRASGFTEQTMRNMLQLNRGDGTFAEVGQLAGVSATDWSWSALFADLDNDGWKDLHVTNGYRRDYTNLDFIKYMDDYVADKGRLQREDVLELLREMPASDLDNFAFRNDSARGFSPVTREWGLQRPSNSNGAVAADLDNDGDLDLVVNNLDAPAFVYRNETRDRNWLQVELSGVGGNRAAIGARVIVQTDRGRQVQEWFPNRGYLSAAPPQLHFGLGDAAQVQYVRVIWPGHTTITVPDPDINQRIRISQSDDKGQPYATDVGEPTIFAPADLPFAHRDASPGVRDFDRQGLLPRQLSATGPVMLSTDLNADGAAELLLAGSPSEGLLLVSPDGSRQRIDLPGLHAAARVTGLASLDWNGDGHTDIFLAIGGYAAAADTRDLPAQRVAVNDGAGGYHLVSLPADVSLSASVVAASPGSTVEESTPVFLGGHAVPGAYPRATPSFLLLPGPDGYARTEPVALDDLGLVTDAAWADLDLDGRPELIVVGEYAPIRVYRWDGSTLDEATSAFLSESPDGWWHTLTIADLNGDGYPDLIAGNEGENSPYRPTANEPLILHAGDYDGNGSLDPLLSYYQDGVRYPDLTRDEWVGQVAAQRGRFPNYAAFADITSDELEGELGEPELRLRVESFRTTLFLSDGMGRLTSAPLPSAVQLAPVHAILPFDADGDGATDLLIAGNEDRARLRFGSSDANAGLLLRGDGRGRFEVVPHAHTGLNLSGSTRALARWRDYVVVGRRDEAVSGYRIDTVVE